MAKQASSKPSQSTEDYLERIQELISRKGYARVSDIAAELNLTRPSVTNMVQRLSHQGFVSYEKYRGITLTEKGKEVALQIQIRHVIITEFLTMLGLDRRTIARDVEGLEHHISPETLKKLEQLVDYWRHNPKQLRDVFLASK